MSCLLLNSFNVLLIKPTFLRAILLPASVFLFHSLFSTAPLALYKDLAGRNSAVVMQEGEGKSYEDQSMPLPGIAKIQKNPFFHSAFQKKKVKYYIWGYIVGKKIWYFKVMWSLEVWNTHNKKLKHLTPASYTGTFIKEGLYLHCRGHL